MVFLITLKNHHYTCAILEQVFDVGLLKLFDPIMGIVIPHICHFFYTGKIFGEENLHRNLHSKLPIYTVNCQFFALDL